MQTTSKERALRILDSVLETKPPVSEYRSVLQRWIRNSRVITEAIFGKQSEHRLELDTRVKEFWNAKSANSPAYGLEFDSITKLLESFRFEISELWIDEDVGREVKYSGAVVETEEEPIHAQSKDVFIVHGHDHGRMQAVARFLEHIGLNPVILHERPSSGATIIEKLETHAKVAFAVVLLTPDDVGSIASDKQNPRSRARQNVVLELGYFLAKLGRRRTCALVVEGVEIPSDYSGVVYIPIDEEGGWKFHLAKELKAAGLPMDLNRLA